MSQAKRLRPHPFMPPFAAERAPAPEVTRTLTEPGPNDETVVCGLSGRRVRKQDAVQARIGPRQTMWIAADLTSEARR